MQPPGVAAAAGGPGRGQLPGGSPGAHAIRAMLGAWCWCCRSWPVQPTGCGCCAPFCCYLLDSCGLGQPFRVCQQPSQQRPRSWCPMASGARFERSHASQASAPWRSRRLKPVGLWALQRWRAPAGWVGVRPAFKRDLPAAHSFWPWPSPQPARLIWALSHGLPVPLLLVGALVALVADPLPPAGMATGAVFRAGLVGGGVGAVARSCHGHAASTTAGSIVVGWNSDGGDQGDPSAAITAGAAVEANGEGVAVMAGQGGFRQGGRRDGPRGENPIGAPAGVDHLLPGGPEGADRALAFRRPRRDRPLPAPQGVVGCHAPQQSRRPDGRSLRESSALDDAPP